MKALALFWLAACLPLFTASCATPDVEIMPEKRDFFEIHTDKWMSLHHFAYHASRALAEKKPRGLVDLDPQDIALLRGEPGSAFAFVADAYAPYTYQSILHDAETRGIAEEIARGPDQISDEKLRLALTQFMPVYEEHFWPRHEKWSADFSKALTAQLDDYGPQMAERLTSFVEQDWPEQAIRVDIVPYANWAGAYTDDGPPHITLGAIDPEISEFAFEILFHEASHTTPLGLSIDVAADHALQQASLESNRYWHYLLFYLSGRAAQEILADPDYVPYAQASGRASLPDAAPYYQALELVWSSEDNLTDRATAAAKLVAERHH